MATLQIVIPDDSPELEELMFMVAEAQLTDPGITAQGYVSNIVMGMTQARIQNIYKKHTSSLTIDELINKLGPLNIVR